MIMIMVMGMRTLVLILKIPHDGFAAALVTTISQHNDHDDENDENDEDISISIRYNNRSNYPPRTRDRSKGFVTSSS